MRFCPVTPLFLCSNLFYPDSETVLFQLPSEKVVRAVKKEKIEKAMLSFDVSK